MKSISLALASTSALPSTIFHRSDIQHSYTLGFLGGLKMPSPLSPGCLPLKSSNIFESKEICKKRLQAFALAQGFAVVVGKSHRDHSIFHCIHHGANTYHDRGFEPRVVGPHSSIPA